LSKAGAVQFEAVTFSFGPHLVLDDVTVSIQSGQMVGIVGPNGGGKTTFLKLVLGLLRPDRGRIRVLGRSPQQARALVGYVPQQFRFDPKFPVTVLDVVLMGRLRSWQLAGRFSSSDRSKAFEALETVELKGLSSRPFPSLSGGERQRVLIARALSTQPEILLLDEPTANVDPGAQAELHRVLLALAGRLTVVMATHDMNFVASGMETVLCINRTAAVHPTGAVSDGGLHGLYGVGVRQVLHGERLCSRCHLAHEGGHAAEEEGGGCARDDGDHGHRGPHEGGRP
jgi:zinc transport system ATP-binding protein